MNPEEIVSKLFEGFKTGKGDLKIIPKDDGGFGIIYGNNGSKGIYEINPKIRKESSKVNYDDLIYDPVIPSFRDFKADSTKIEGTKAEIIQALQSGKFNLDLIGQYDRKQLVENYNRTQRRLNKEAPRGTPGPIYPQESPESNTGLEAQFGFGVTDGSSFLGSAKTIGAIGYNGLVEAAVNTVESTYGVGKDIVTGGVPGVTKTLKDLYGGALNLFGAVGSAVSASQELLGAWAKNGELPSPETIKNAYDVRQNTWEQKTSPIQPSYNQEEKQLIENSYNDQYTKDFEKFKKDITVDFKSPEGEPSWQNPEWVASTFASGLQSGIGFMGGLYASNFLVTKGAGAVGKGLGTVKGNLNLKNAQRAETLKWKETLQKYIDKPDFESPSIKAYIKSRVGKVTVDLEEAAARGKHTGEVIGSTGAMIGGTKFEADLEKFQAYDQYMQEATQAKIKELVDTGIPPEQATKIVEDSDMEEAKVIARAKAENVGKANLAILGLSNLASYKLLGLFPKSNMSRAYGSIAARNATEEVAPITNELFAPWTSRWGKAALDLGKEGYEESIQTDITKYEGSKDSASNSSMETIIGGGLTAFKDLYNLDPEVTMSFITGAATSGGFNAARWGFGEMRQKGIKEKLKFIDTDKINSVITDPLNMDENVIGHLKFAFEAMQNEIAKGAAEQSKDWQLRHVLEQEGLNKLYYQARENGVEHNDTVKHILGALKARTGDLDIKSSTPYISKNDIKAQFSEIENALASTAQTYDYSQRIFKDLNNKNYNITPELRKRVFEAVGNLTEFQSVGKFLEEQKNKTQGDPIQVGNIEQDIKLNDAYVKAYTKVLTNLIKDNKNLKKDSDEHKAHIIETAVEETGKSPEAVISEISQTEQEAADLSNLVDQKKSAKNEAKFLQETAHFQRQVDSFFREGGVNNAMGFREELNHDTFESLIKGYNESLADLTSDPKTKKLFEEKKKAIIKAALSRLRDAAGSQTPEQVDQRYNNSEAQRSFLFMPERTMLVNQLNNVPGVNSSFVEALSQVKNTTDLKALVLSPDRNEVEKRIINTFYSQGENREEEIPEIQNDETLFLDDFPVDDSVEIPLINDSVSLDELFENSNLIRPCNI